MNKIIIATLLVIASISQANAWQNQCTTVQDIRTGQITYICPTR